MTVTTDTRNPALEVTNVIVRLLARNNAIQAWSKARGDNGERLPAVEVELSTAVGETGRFLITVEPAYEQPKPEPYVMSDGALQEVLF